MYILHYNESSGQQSLNRKGILVPAPRKVVRQIAEDAKEDSDRGRASLRALQRAAADPDNENSAAARRALERANLPREGDPSVG